jgi:hypothetical protein
MSQHDETCSGRVCCIAQPSCIRRDSHAPCGLRGGRKCSGAALVCQLKFCSTYQGIDEGFWDKFC